MRVLETLHRKASVNLFQENVANVLASNVALNRPGFRGGRLV